MDRLLDLFLDLTNTGLLAGLVVAALLALRPILLRLFSAQQRVVIWLVAWSLGYMPHLDRRAMLPVTFQTLIVPRTGQYFGREPAFLPAAYEGPGAYNIALPGKAMVEVSLTDGLVYGAMILWLAGILALCVFFWQRGRRLTALVRRGQPLDDAMLEGYQLNKNILEGFTNVWLVPGLPTSFVRYRLFGNEIAIQAELSPGQLELVLLHEVQHVHLWHPWWKIIATVNVVLFWWNPLIWLGFRYFCRDLELACDASVMKKLEPDKRKQYAKTLVELGSGRQLWEVPLAFGECDAQVRVRSVTKWKPRHIALALLTWCAAVGVMLFFYGGQRVTYQAEDLKLAYEREYGGMVEFVETLNDGLADHLGLVERYGIAATPAPDLGITQVWEAPDKTYTKKVNVGFYPEEGIRYRTTTLTAAALWVQTGDGSWYYTAYGWYGQGTNTFFVLNAEGCEAPDLTGVFRLV